MTAAQVVRSLDLGGVRLSESNYPAGTELPDHAHDQAMVSITIRGSFRMTANDRENSYGAGTVFIMAPGVMHRNLFPEDTQLLRVDINDEVFAHFDPHLLPARPLIVVAAEALAQLPRRIRGEFGIGDTISRFALRGLLLELVVQSIRASRDERLADPASSWAETTRYVDTHLEVPMSMSTLARALGRDPQSVARDFRSARGISIRDYVRQRRLERAAESLVESDAALARIASEIGFFDQAHFSREFKRSMGVPPLRYRKRAAKIMFPIGARH